MFPENGPLAFFICDGTRQQVPFETLDCVAKVMCDAHTEQGGHAEIVGRMRTVETKENLIFRVEVTLKVASGQTRQIVHLDAAYWAPVTEGAITYRQTPAFLLRSGWGGVKAIIKGRFDRWIFGDLPERENLASVVACRLRTPQPESSKLRVHKFTCFSYESINLLSFL